MGARSVVTFCADASGKNAVGFFAEVHGFKIIFPASAPVFFSVLFLLQTMRLRGLRQAASTRSTLTLSTFPRSIHPLMSAAAACSSFAEEFKIINPNKDALFA